MFDFTDHYTLSELLALDNFMCYVRTKAAESVDLRDLRSDLNKEHRALSRIINSKLDEAAEEWDVDHKNTGAYKAVVSEPVTPVMAQQAEQVDRIVQACIAGAPPAEEPDDLQALVDTLSRCSVQLVALALAEDRRFAESGQTNAFIKLTVLRNASRSIIDMLADIRNHYDGLH